jgi:uncharacterized protein (DUF433 family)
MEDRVVVDPKIGHGKPVIRGTRTPVALIVGSLAGGMSFEDVQSEYDLTIEDVRAALRFAGELLDQEQHHNHARAGQVVRVLETFARTSGWLELLAGRLAIVEPSRVRFRPAP